MKKNVLIIDGNYFLISRLHVLPKKKGKILLDTDTECNMLMRKLSMDFASEFRKMKGIINDVYFAVDADSWRKDLSIFMDDIDIPHDEVVTYKGNRVKKETVNWSNVFSVFKEFYTILADVHGVNVIRSRGAEADDIAYMSTVELRNSGHNAIVWSGDKDLVQLVGQDQSTDSWVIWYDNTRKRVKITDDMLYLFTANEPQVDVFNLASANEDVTHKLTKWVKDNSIVIEVEDIEYFLFEKILMGDKGDNVEAVVFWAAETKSGTINRKVTKKNVEKIYDKYVDKNGHFSTVHFFNRDLMESMAEITQEVVGRGVKDEILNRIYLNTKLMLLHSKTIPLPIQDSINESLSTVNGILKPSKLVHLEKILEGTKWLDKKKSYVPKSFDVFGGLDETKSKETKENKGGLF